MKFILCCTVLKYMNTRETSFIIIHLMYIVILYTRHGIQLVTIKLLTCLLEYMIYFVLYANKIKFIKNSIVYVNYAD